MVSLIAIVPANQDFRDTKIAKILTATESIYPYFVRVVEKDNMGKITRSNKKLKDILNKNVSFLLKPRQKIEFISNRFVSELFSSNEKKENETLEILSTSSDDVNLRCECDRSNNSRSNKKSASKQLSHK